MTGELLSTERGGMKSALMDQGTIAGLGNITVDEILWRTKVDPRRTLDTLDEQDLRRIERKTKDVMRKSVNHGRVPHLLLVAHRPAGGRMTRGVRAVAPEWRPPR